jgi:hypothetical protein
MARKKNGEIRLKGGSTGTSAEGIYISVFCRGPVEVPHEKWRIGSFVPGEHNGAIVWHESTSGYAEQGGTTLTRVYPPIAQWLKGNEHVDRENADPNVFYDADFRIDWLLKCKTCGYAKKIGKPSKAYPVLTALIAFAVDGILEIPLRAFAARVDKAP